MQEVCWPMLEFFLQKEAAGMHAESILEINTKRNAIKNVLPWESQGKVVEPPTPDCEEQISEDHEIQHQWGIYWWPKLWISIRVQ